MLTALFFHWYLIAYPANNGAPVILDKFFFQGSCNKAGSSILGHDFMVHANQVEHSHNISDVDNARKRSDYICVKM